MLSYKLLLVSTTFLSVAIMLKFSAPALLEFAVYEVPLIYNGVVSWLKPPYLYLVINCIIITIIASIKLQSTKDDVSPSEPMVPVKIILTDYPAAEFKYDDVVLNDLRSDDVKEEKVLQFDDDANEQRTEIQTTPFVSQFDDVTSNKENEFVIAKSTWNSVDKKDSTEYFPSNVKPPVSARFGHRKNVKASPEGGKTILGVSKTKSHDTLESTWKTITEGRAIPLTRHLRKSDTWGERDNRGQSLNQEKINPQKMMTKAETFNDRANTRSPSPGSASSGGSGKMRREPSLGQDELNRRVEAFINKFNEDMRMQRQESLKQYKKMVKPGSH